jgi:hypothetical protein
MIPRIVTQAAVLFFRRRLHVWYRPEPLKDSIGRNADSTERSLEPIFRRYLHLLAEGADISLALIILPSGISEVTTERMLSKAVKLNDPAAEEVEFRVLTRIFYTRFACYAHDLEAIFCQFRGSCTIWVPRPQLLPRSFLKRPSPPLKSSRDMHGLCLLQSHTSSAATARTCGQTPEIQ